MKRLGRSILVAAMLGMLTVPGQVTAAHGRPASTHGVLWQFTAQTAHRFKTGSGTQPIGTDPTLPPTTPVGGNPVFVAIDDATHTAYVTNGNDGTVSVVDTTHCRAGDTSGCQRQWPTFSAGFGPVAVNQVTDTVYAVGAGSIISVIDGATCNAAVHTGCNAPLASVPVGACPNPTVDEATNTIYVLNSNCGGPGQGSVSVLNGNSCDAANTSGCSQTPPAVTVGENPTWLALDSTNHTVYVANCGAGSVGGPGCTPSGTLSMIDAAHCNASVTSGCSQSPPTVTVPAGAFWVDTDLSTDTVYVAGIGPSLGSVSVIDGATCNATVTSGCAKPQPTAVVGSGPAGMVVDQQTHNVFVISQEDSSVSVIDGATCNAAISRGCSAPALTVGVWFDTSSAGLDPATQTLYVPSQDFNLVSVVDATACTTTHRSGCRQEAPTTTTGSGPQGEAVDPTTGTFYVTNQEDNTLSLVNANACNAAHLSGCAASWPTVAVGTTPKFVAIDGATRTGYISDTGDGIVWAFDLTRCNASVHTGCQFHPITVSTNNDYLDWMAVDDATHTLYVTDRNTDGLALIDVSACHTGNFSGCGQTPKFASTGTGSRPDGVVLNSVSRSLYVADSGTGTVSLLNAATCNAQVTSGCATPHPTVTVDSTPTRIALDQQTNTVFVASKDTGRVSVIDGRTCNAGATAGCGAPVANFSVAYPPAGEVAHPINIGVDPSTNLIYLTDVVDSDILVLNGATCNGQNTSGCTRRIGSLIRTGGWATNIVFDPSLGTGYSPDNVDGNVSVFSLLD